MAYISLTVSCLSIMENLPSQWDILENVLLRPFKLSNGVWCQGHLNECKDALEKYKKMNSVGNPLGLTSWHVFMIRSKGVCFVCVPFLLCISLKYIDTTCKNILERYSIWSVKRQWHLFGLWKLEMQQKGSLVIFLGGNAQCQKPNYLCICRHRMVIITPLWFL